MAKIKAKGVILKYGDSASPTTTIPQTADISMDAGAWDRADTTTHDTSGVVKNYITILREPASVDVSVLLDPADTAHEWVRASHASGDQKYLTLVLPDAGAAQFALRGHITNYAINSATVGGMLQASFTFAADSVETFTA